MVVGNTQGMLCQTPAISQLPEYKTPSTPVFYPHVVTKLRLDYWNFINLVLVPEMGYIAFCCGIKIGINNCEMSLVSKILVL